MSQSDQTSIQDILIDDFVYARNKKDTTNTSILVEKLKAGTRLDPIEVQKVSEYGEDNAEATILISGGHRLDAYEEFNKLEEYENQEPEFIFYNDEVLDYETHKVDLLVRSHNDNEHGNLPSRNQDTKKTACNMRLADPNLTAEEIGKRLNRTRSTISEHIKHIVQQQRATNKMIAVRLDRLGLSQTEIAEVISKDQTTVSRLLNSMQKDGPDILHSFNDLNKTIQEIASYHDLDTQTVWSYLLESKSDNERLKELGIPLKTYDVWNFSECDDRMGMDYPGRIPGQLVVNALYYYTKPEDLVLDPMAGGGVVVDACLLMNRRCKAYDLNPQRDDIVRHDIEDGLPPLSDRCDLLFIDPPYWSMLKDKYVDESVSSKDLEDFNNWLRNLAKECYQTMQRGSRLAFLIQNQTEKDLPEVEYYIDHIYEAQTAFQDAGFKSVRRIACPQSTETFTPQQVNSAKKDGRMLGIVRDLLVFIKE